MGGRERNKINIIIYEFLCCVFFAAVVLFSVVQFIFEATWNKHDQTCKHMHKRQTCHGMLTYLTHTNTLTDSIAEILFCCFLFVFVSFAKTKKNERK